MARWFARILTAGIAGMGGAAWLEEGVFPLLFLVSAGLVAWVALTFRRSILIGAFFMALTLWGGALWYLERWEAWTTLPERVEFQGEAVIVDRDEAKVFYVPVTLRPTDTRFRGGDILYRAPLTFAAAPGATVFIDCTIERPENFDPNFDYRLYLASRGTGYTCDRAREFSVNDEIVEWRSALFSARQWLKRHITTLFPEPEAGLLTGLFIGGDALSSETKETFAKTGLSHIVAVSGYNMSIIAEGIVLFGFLLGLWRRTALQFAVIGIGSFLLFIDGSAASLRAALMTWFAFAAYFVGRPPASMNGLLLAALFMLIVNPLLIRYDVGFQLSFLATLALLMLSLWFETLSFFRTWYGKITALFLATTVIELFTTPIIVNAFGTFSLVAPIANTLILPLVPVSMLLGAIALVCSALFPPLAPLFALPAWLTLALITRGTELLSMIPHAQISGLALPPSFAMLWYLGLTVFLIALERLRHRYVLGMDHEKPRTAPRHSFMRFVRAFHLFRSGGES